MADLHHLQDHFSNFLLNFSSLAKYAKIEIWRQKGDLRCKICNCIKHLALRIVVIFSFHRQLSGYGRCAICLILSLYSNKRWLLGYGWLGYVQFFRNFQLVCQLLAMLFVVDMAILNIDMSLGLSIFRQSTILTIDNSTIDCPHNLIIKIQFPDFFLRSFYYMCKLDFVEYSTI